MSMMMQTARAPYRPDPSQGDPGLFGALRRGLGFAARTALGMTGFGGAAAAVQGAALRTGQNGDRMPPSPPMRPMVGTQVMVPRPGVVGAVQRFLPGGFSGTQVATVGPNGACPPKFRLNKTSYTLKDGTFVPAGTRCVRKRRMNPTNPKAMSRSIQRIDAGKRFQHRMSTIATANYTAAGKKRDSCR